MAKLGTPALTTPRQIDVRSVQQLVDNIRERFVAVESAVAANTKGIAAAPAAGSADMVGVLADLRRDLDNLAAAVGGAGVAEDRLLLLMPDNTPQLADAGERLLWPSEGAPAPAVNDASAILAAQVFGA